MTTVDDVQVGKLDARGGVLPGADERVLWLVRHAKSSWTSGARSDHDRPLASRGRRDSASLGAWLAAHAVSPERVWCSTAARTIETLDRAREQWDLAAKAVAYRPELYGVSGDGMLDLMRQVPATTGSLMLIGHNPGLDELLMLLCGLDLPRTEKGKLLTTANIAAIRLVVPWAAAAAGSGVLRLLARPR